MPQEQNLGELATVDWVAQRYDVSPRTLDNWVKHHGFPKPIVLNKRQRRWHLAEIIKWEQARSTSSLEAAE